MCEKSMSQTDVSQPGTWLTYHRKMQQPCLIHGGYAETQEEMLGCVMIWKWILTGTCCQGKWYLYTFFPVEAGKGLVANHQNEGRRKGERFRHSQYFHRMAVFSRLGQSWPFLLRSQDENSRKLCGCAMWMWQQNSIHCLSSCLAVPFQKMLKYAKAMI